MARLASVSPHAGTCGHLWLGEAVGLEWRDVDFDQRVLIVRRSVNYRKRQARAPKNGQRRRVDLSR